MCRGVDLPLNYDGFTCIAIIIKSVTYDRGRKEACHNRAASKNGANPFLGSMAVCAI